MLHDSAPWPESWADRRSRVTRWRHRLGDRRPLEATLARALWLAHLKNHDGDREAALGELVGALLAGDLLDEEPRW